MCINPVKSSCRKEESLKRRVQVSESWTIMAKQIGYVTRVGHCNLVSYPHKDSLTLHKPQFGNVMHVGQASSRYMNGPPTTKWFHRAKPWRFFNLNHHSLESDYIRSVGLDGDGTGIQTVPVLLLVPNIVRYQGLIALRHQQVVLTHWYGFKCIKIFNTLADTDVW